MGKILTIAICAVSLVAVFTCAGCSSDHSVPSSAHTRSLDDKTGEQLLSNAFSGWMATNATQFSSSASVSTVPVGASKLFRLVAPLRGPGQQTGQVSVDVTRPTLTQSKADCGASWLRQCEVKQLQGFTVMSTAGSTSDTEIHQYSVEVYDSDNNLMALGVDQASNIPPLTREQAIDLSVRCAAAFN